MYHSTYTCSEYHSIYYNFYELKPENRSDNLVSPENPSRSKSVTGKEQLNVNMFKPVIKNIGKKGSKMTWIPKVSN